jgi:GNAT superfamily N-acetyltransferase
LRLQPSLLQARTDIVQYRMPTGDGLLLEATVSPDSRILHTFYASYDDAFVLPNEKEAFDGFAKCLALNFGDSYERLSQLYGAFREIVLIARDPDGALVGGANLIAFPLGGGGVLSINLNYVFVVPEQRRQGHFKRLVAAIGDMAAGFFEPAGAPIPRLMFIEQNDPVQMTRADYACDTRHSGIDQMTRIRLWTALGAKIIDFPYVQPPLSTGQAPDERLVYAVLGAGGNTLDACVLHAHLLRFFGISVLKGSDPLADSVAGPQLSGLALRCGRNDAIPLLTATDLPSQMQGDFDTGKRTSLRELIKSGT